MDLTRKQVIEELQKMLDYCSIRQDSTPERKQALVYAISSLITDEAYQLMYEGVKVYTKDEVITMLTELKAEIEKTVQEYGGLINKKWANGLHYSEKIIQQKINELEGVSNE